MDENKKEGLVQSVSDEETSQSSNTSDLDIEERRVQLEKLLQYPETNSLNEQTGTGGVQFSTSNTRRNDTENHIRDVYIQNNETLSPLVQYSSDVYTNKQNTDTMNPTSQEPLVQLSSPEQENIVSSGDSSSVSSERLMHLLTSPYDVDDGVISTINRDTSTPLLHLHSTNNQNIQANEPTVEDLLEQAIQNNQDLQTVIKQYKAQRGADENAISTRAVTNLTIPSDEDTSPITFYPTKEAARQANDQRDIEYIEEQIKQHKQEQLKETYLNPLELQAKERSTNTSPDTIKPLHHFRGDVYNKNYKYLSPEEPAKRSSIIGLEGSHRGTRQDQFDADDNVWMDNPKYGHMQSDGSRKFQGSHTRTYMEGETRKKQIQEYQDGLYDDEVSHYGERALSPLDPFTRLGNGGTNDLYKAQYATAFAYNRTHVLIADLEWRKGFRHLFITRPECYIMTNSRTLSDQCRNDETFYTSWQRMPHISYLLSPSYFSYIDIDGLGTPDNFNYLLSNRVSNMNPIGIEMDQLQSVQKSTRNATVMPGTFINNQYGNSLSLTFRDTKNLEVYECLRLWMEYITNVYLGKFASSYNNYEQQNTYGNSLYHPGENGYSSINYLYHDSPHLHPYDRALDYCATIFDIVTNEAGTKIVYWCKYVGVYPMSAVQNGMSDNANQALTNEQTISARFYYQGKEEYKMKSLVEFNYNAGIVDALGRPIDVDTSGGRGLGVTLPFLLTKNYNPYGKTMIGPSGRNMSYIGAASMFTGRPYIVLNTEDEHLMSGAKRTTHVTPQLRFAPLLAKSDAHTMNANIDSNFNDGLETVVQVKD